MICTLDMVPSHTIDQRWDEVLPLMEKASQRCGGRYDAHDLRIKIRDDGWQLWLMMNGNEAIAALVTQIIKWPKLLEMRMIIMVGEGMEDWINLLSLIEEYAKKIGCVKISGVARIGWEKILNEYRKTHVFLEKDL